MKKITRQSKRGVIYLRTAIKEQAPRKGQFHHLEQQENYCKKYAVAHGIKIVKIFRDDGASGMTMDRNGLQEMLKFCGQKSNKIDCVIVYGVDRLTRSSMDYSSIWVMLSGYGIGIISTTESIDDTPMSKFIHVFLAANAMMHNKMISELTKRGIVARKQRLALANQQSTA